eukprot:CAMPEP_0202380564 /NCGR_PEP_ID=MMETSP1127-20130417/29492_1 /ASSEMBLY_ACC=CAM_ASM_000462 /TAXON_ID=3047 /ORGANISM="Dunaliella tertiolecta, Strain CCMP1320" /LENGTH=96 /DNA_ID=CAMNT_0048979289 /DNA_START=26 /DNA_END=313 /DNA_ORIENTATION=+
MDVPKSAPQPPAPDALQESAPQSCKSGAAASPAHQPPFRTAPADLEHTTSPQETPSARQPGSATSFALQLPPQATCGILRHTPPLQESPPARQPGS